MKTLGLIGGTSWHSTIDYYRYINERVNTHFGDNTNPPLLIYNLNQSLIHQYQIVSNWNAIAELLIKAGKSLQNAGAESLMFCANTPHKVYNSVASQMNIPIIHIADATANAINLKGLKKVCFLGTKYTMEEDFVTQRIRENGIEVIVPENKIIIEELHRIIQKELTFGIITSKSKEFIMKVIGSLVNLGAEGVVLGCTEFPLIIKEDNLEISVFNSTKIHANSGVEFILSE